MEQNVKESMQKVRALIVSGTIHLNRSLNSSLTNHVEASRHRAGPTMRYGESTSKQPIGARHCPLDSSGAWCPAVPSTDLKLPLD